jgi:hypothetical protein
MGQMCSPETSVSNHFTPHNQEDGIISLTAMEAYYLTVFLTCNHLQHVNVNHAVVESCLISHVNNKTSNK